MKLCLVTSQYAGITHPYTGGIGTWAASFAAALAKYGHQVEVLTPDPTTSGIVRTPEGVAVHRHQVAVKRGALVDLRDGVIWPRVVKDWLLDRREADLVVAPEWGGAAAAFAACRNRPVLITQLHGSAKQIRRHSDIRRIRIRSGLPSALTAHREFLQARRSNALFGCSRAVLSDAMEHWKLRPRITGVLPNLIEIAALKTSALGEPPHLPLGRYVLFFGRLEPLKGVHTLAEAMRPILAANPDVYLVLAGADRRWHHGSMIAHVRKLAGEHLERVIYLEELPPRVLAPLIAKSDIVALPSRFEAFPFSVLETIALGRPLVTTSGHGASDMVSDGSEAILVPPENPHALRRALERLLADKELRCRLEERAAARAQRYDHGPGAARATEIFERLLAIERTAYRASNREDDGIRLEW